MVEAYKTRETVTEANFWKYINDPKNGISTDAWNKAIEGIRAGMDKNAVVTPLISEIVKRYKLDIGNQRELESKSDMIYKMLQRYEKALSLAQEALNKTPMLDVIQAAREDLKAFAGTKLWKAGGDSEIMKARLTEELVKMQNGIRKIVDSMPYKFEGAIVERYYGHTGPNVTLEVKFAKTVQTKKLPGSFAMAISDHATPKQIKDEIEKRAKEEQMKLDAKAIAQATTGVQKTLRQLAKHESPI